MGGAFNVVEGSQLQKAIDHAQTGGQDVDGAAPFIMSGADNKS